MSGVSLVNDGAALLSMRNSDFDANSAVGEVIDNSIQAGAKKVRLIVNFKASKEEPITSIAFGDDGIGMSRDVLHRCLQLGYSTRYNDRGGIGRFGVGATLAAINQCKKIEVYSKEKGGDWLYTYVDGGRDHRRATAPEQARRDSCEQSQGDPEPPQGNR